MTYDKGGVLPAVGVAMKTLSVRQPFAHWMFTPDPMFGIKSIENRRWSTDHRGPLLIHAGAKDHPDYKGSFYMTPDMLHSVILGTVDLVDVHRYRSIDCRHRPCLVWGERGDIWHWVLANPRLLPEPIPAKGQLRLWDFDLQSVKVT